MISFNLHGKGDIIILKHIGLAENNNSDITIVQLQKVIVIVTLLTQPLALIYSIQHIWAKYFSYLQHLCTVRPLTMFMPKSNIQDPTSQGKVRETYLFLVPGRCIREILKIESVQK